MKLARNSGHRHRRTYQLHIDEAGRGPLAGPVTVGCTLMHDNELDLSNYKDSKQLTHTRRESLYDQIQHLTTAGQISPGVGHTTPAKIDQHEMIWSLRQATLQAIGQCLLHAYLTHWRPAMIDSPYGKNIMAIVQLDKLFDTNTYTMCRISDILEVEQLVFGISVILIDGNHTFGLEKLPVPITTIIKGDAKNPRIGMASIIAKVERDRWMMKLGKKHTLYGFDTHKGYGTQTHRASILTHGLTKHHRVSYCTALLQLGAKHCTSPSTRGLAPQGGSSLAPLPQLRKTLSSLQHALPREGATKPPLLLHICCGPDLTWPLHRLKHHFKLYLFWYNPNIHPRKEHSMRYAQFLKLVGLEAGDYEIIEDWYDPKEFFRAMVDQKDTISKDLVDADTKTVLQVAGEMPERSDRCNPCYSMRLDQAAKQAVKHDIPYFTSTLLISPKKHGGKLFDRGVDAERKHGSHFLWFDFAKNEGYSKAVHLTRKHKLVRQNYCGCGRTVPKPGEKRKAYSGG